MASRDDDDRMQQRHQSSSFDINSCANFTKTETKGKGDGEVKRTKGKKWATTRNQVYWNSFTFIPNIPGSKQFLFIFFQRLLRARKRGRGRNMENWIDAYSSGFSILHKPSSQTRGWKRFIFTAFNSIVRAAHPISPKSLRQKTRLNNKQNTVKTTAVAPFVKPCARCHCVIIFAHSESTTRRIIVKCLVVLRPVHVFVCLCVCWCG